MHILPIFSTLVTFIFLGVIVNRWLRKGGTHLLFWSLGFLFYGLGTLSEVILGLVFSPFVLKLWYLCGAMLTAAWLGQGSVFLLVRKGNLARVLAGILIAVSLLAAGLVFAAPLTGSVYDPAIAASAQYREVLTRNGLTVALTIILNIYGTLTLVGGTIYSAFLFWRKKVLANRLYGNILIAAGALFPAMGGSFIKAGLVDLLYASELAGAVLMFLGFLLATAGKEAKRSPKAKQAKKKTAVKK